MRKGNLSREQLVTMIGENEVVRLERENCEPTSRVQTGRANAHLIAAAPELLEACYVALGALSEREITPDQGVARDALRRAIAKATGA